jgi:hypothetical protein
LKRQEAVTCLKEINAATGISPEAVALFPSKAEDNSTGYQMHIKIAIDSKTKQTLQNIAEKYGLSVKEEEGKVVIYESKRIQKQLNTLP